MADKRQVGVRYCGGCNSRYDRVALVKRLGSFFPEVEFVNALPGVLYPAALVVCGCPSRCANTSDLAVPAGRLIPLNGWEDLLPSKEKLTLALQEQEVLTLTHQQVLEILPHRPPMLFIDEVSRLVPGEEVVASFLARPDLPAFAGHFPGSPVLPGIYTIEAVAQAADILMMSAQRYAGTLPLFMGVREATFRRKILPGETLDIHVSLLEEKPSRAIAFCRGQVFVDGALAADLEVRLAFR